MNRLLISHLFKIPQRIIPRTFATSIVLKSDPNEQKKKKEDQQVDGYIDDIAATQVVSQTNTIIDKPTCGYYAINDDIDE